MVGLTTCSPSVYIVQPENAVINIRMVLSIKSVPVLARGCKERRKKQAWCLGTILKKSFVLSTVFLARQLELNSRMEKLNCRWSKLIQDVSNEWESKE